MVRVNDEKELAKRYDEVHVDTKSSQVSLPTFRNIHLIFLSKMCLPRNIYTHHFFHIFRPYLKLSDRSLTTRQLFRISCPCYNIAFYFHVSNWLLLFEINIHVLEMFVTRNLCVV